MLDGSHHFEIDKAVTQRPFVNTMTEWATLGCHETFTGIPGQLENPVLGV